MRADGRRSALQPTFVDGTNHSFSSFGIKRPLRAESHLAVSSSSADAQWVKTEFMSQIQAVVSRQESQMRQLDSQLAQLDQELKPKVQNVERRQNAVSQQVEDARAKVHTISNNEISPLQNQLDQIATKFDRFVRSEIETKLKPMQEELRQSRNKVDELVSSSNASFKRLNEQVRDLTEKVNATSGNLEEESDNISSQLEDLRPAVITLSGHIDELRESVENDQSGVDPTELARQIDKIEQIVEAIETDELPRQLEESNAPFAEVIEKLKSYCDSKVGELQRNIGNISKNSASLDNQKRQAEEAIRVMIKESMEVQRQISQTEMETKAKITEMERRYDSAMQAAQDRMSEITEERDHKVTVLNTQTRDEVDSLKQQVQNTVRMIKDSLRDATSENQKAQEIAIQQINKIRTELEGEEGLMSRIRRIEEQVDYCINSITEVHRRRSKMQKAGGNAANVLGRVQNLEARLAHAESRLSTVDGKPEARKPRMVRAVEKIAAVPPEADAGKDSRVKPPAGRELPRPGDQVFSDSSSSRRSASYEREVDYQEKRGSVRRHRRTEEEDEDVEASPGDSLRRNKRRRH